MTTADRYQGCLFGLAIGDAVGTTLEFTSPGTFKPITDMVGGGPFHLPIGAFTDDTSMALCLSASLVFHQEMNLTDQMNRYVNWMRYGYMSATGDCFDIGMTVSKSLHDFLSTKDPLSGPTDPMTAGNGSLMRLAPVPMFFGADPEQAIEACALSSRTTHGAPAAVDACRFYGGLIIGALQGKDKEALLAPLFHPSQGKWEAGSLDPSIEEVALGSYKDRQPPEIMGTGYVVKSMEAALWAFYHSGDFREGCLLAANLGEDADTTAAIYGQLAGAYYGLQGIPQVWTIKIKMRTEIRDFAQQLYELGPGKSL